jgi:hypothetical protein
MNPIELEVHKNSTLSPKEICSIILDTSQWSKFEGYLFLPGIEKAEFEKRTDSVVGSKIKVHNKDGSTHIEEIIEWDENRKVAFKFQEFNSPLKNFATHFIEEWNFTILNSGTEIRRGMKMHPKNLLGLIILKPVSILMKKALKKNLEQLNRASIK